MCDQPGHVRRRCCFASILALGILSAAGNGRGDGGGPSPTPAPARPRVPSPAPAQPPVIGPEEAIALALQSRISDMGPDGDAPFDASRPAVAYNGTEDRYLVVWEGDDDVDRRVEGEIEIHAQLIDAFTEQQLGADDFRVSHMGPDGDPAFGAHRPSVAYNSTDNQYLVVWHGDDNSLGLADEEFEIWGQLLDATGAAIGGAIRISAAGSDGDPAIAARHPQVVYNSVANQYLVVWEADDDTPPLAAGEFEIFGQLLDATGAGIGPDDFRISDMGPNSHPGYDASNPAVAYNHAANEYLVVWEGDTNTRGLVANEFEIFGQLLDAGGQEVGENDFRISVTGPDGADEFDAAEPSAACNGTADQYLVAWAADGPPLPDNKFEIRVQRIDAVTGARLEIDDVLVSATGDTEDADRDASAPSVTGNAAGNAWLVVWDGDDTSGGLADNEFEIYGRLVTFPPTGSQFRVSDMGTDDGNGQFDARAAAVAFNGLGNEFLVVWEGDDDTGALADDELEIYGQRLAADASQMGANDFRISSAGPDGDLAYDAGQAQVAYNSINHEYLVVWQGDDDASPLVEGEEEIFGQRIDAVTGEEVGANDFRISDMGPDGDPEYDATQPAVAYNRNSSLYLVVWSGDDNTGSLVDEEFEIFGQLIDAATGSEIGTDFRISDVGPDGLASRDAHLPAAAHDSTGNRFLVVWEADDTDAGTPNHKNEIYGQLLEGATGAEFGANDFRISDMAQQDDPDRDGREPAAVFNRISNEFLVVWRGEDDGMAIDEFDIFGQRIDAATGDEVGTNDFRISDMGPDGDPDFDATSVAVVHNSTSNQYLVVWRGDDDAGGLVNDEFEIFGQRLDAAGAEIGANDIRISDMGPDGDPAFDAVQPSVAYNRLANVFLVAWEGNDDGQGLAPGETEVFVQRLDAGGAEIGENDLRATHFGDDGDASVKAGDPAVAFGAAEGSYLIAWDGDAATGQMINEEFEIYSTLVGPFPCAADVDGDGAVGITDLLELLAQWGTDPGGPPDLDGDGAVGIADLLEMLATWGQCQ